MYFPDEETDDDVIEGKTLESQASMSDEVEATNDEDEDDDIDVADNTEV